MEKKHSFFSRTLCIILSVIMLLSVMPLTIIGFADTQGNFTYKVENGEATITDYPEDATGAVTIPSKINGYPVTSIDDGAFKDCTGLTSIKIPDSVTSIGYAAFEHCRGLTSITIPNSVTNIDGAAFFDCTGLKSIKIPDNVTSIEDQAFFGCTGLTSITIPDSVTSIWGSAFVDCTGLKSITIPDSVTSIGDCAFSYCTGLTSITIPDSVTSIGYNAFYNTAYYNNSSNWKNGVLYIGKHLIDAKNDISGSYTIKSGTKCIADYSLSYCKKLTTITIPDSVTSIGEDAFYYCTGLTSVIIGNSVTSIGQSAFCGCTGLTSIIIPDGVTSIGMCAFYGCTGLTSITIPDSVNSIDWWVFDCCEDLVLKVVEGSYAEDWAIDNGYKYVSSHVIVKVAYKASTCTATGNNAYYKCTECGKVFKDSAGKTETTVKALTIAKKAHKLTKVAYKAATCTATGNNAYYKCSVCGKIFKDSAGKTETTVKAQTIAKKGHKLTKTAGVAPTCTKKGYWTYYTCSVCGKVFSDAAGTKTTTVAGQARKATGHKITKVAYKAATCTSTGNYTYYKCSNCGKVYVDSDATKVTTVKAQTIATKAHKIIKVAAKTATCTATGNNAHYKCSVCGKVFKDSAGKTETTVKALTIARKAHKLTKVAYKAATCTATGNNAYYKCSVCGKIFKDSAGKTETTVKAQTIAKKAHKLTKVAYKAATCTAAGNNAYYKCSVCNKVFKDSAGKTETTVKAQTIAKKAHKLTKVAYKAATCTATGNYTYYKCSNCGKVYVDSAATKVTTVNAQAIKLKAHKLTYVPAVAVTNFVKGNKAYYKCSVCGKLFTDSAATKETTLSAVTIEPKYHKWGSPKVTKKATCTETGTKVYTCTVEGCGKTKTETIAAKGHSLTKTAYKAATCTAAGNSTYYKCSTCGKLFTNSAGTKATTLAKVTLAAKGHSWNSGTVTKAATCTTSGTKLYKCTICSTTKTETIAAKGHSLDKIIYEDGTVSSGEEYFYYKCTLCGKYFTDAAGKYETTEEAEIEKIKNNREIQLAESIEDTITYTKDTEIAHSFFYFAQGVFSVNEPEESGRCLVSSFSTKESDWLEIVKEYVEYMTTIGYEIVKTHSYEYNSYSNYSAALVYTAKDLGCLSTMQYEDAYGDITIYIANDGSTAKGQVWYSEKLTLTDTGRRCRGETADLTLLGDSATAGLMKKGDTFYTTDNRLSVTLGKASFIRDGERFTTNAYINSADDEKNYVFYTDVYDEDGAICGFLKKSDMASCSVFDNYVLAMDGTSYRLLGYYNIDTLYKAANCSIGAARTLVSIHDNKLKTACKTEDTGVKKLCLRVMYYEEDVVAVCYAAVEYDYSPYITEVLMAFDLSDVSAQNLNGNSSSNSSSDDSSDSSSSSNSTDKTCIVCNGTGKRTCFQCTNGKVSCSACNGVGYDYNMTTNKKIRCTACSGTGKKKCDNCNGTGKTNCSSCNGTGKR